MSSKSSSVDLKKIGGGIGHFFERYRTILFFSLVSAGLAACLLTVMQIINSSSQATPDQSDIVNQNFDTDTIKRLQQLNNSDHHFQQPSGRINPFVE